MKFASIYYCRNLDIYQASQILQCGQLTVQPTLMSKILKGEFFIHK